MVESGGKYGYIDTFGTYVIEPKFDYASGFGGGIARFIIEVINPDGKTHYKNGYFNKTGTIISELDGEDFSEGLAHVKSGDKYGYIDKTVARSSACTNSQPQ